MNFRVVLLLLAILQIGTASPMVSSRLLSHNPIPRRSHSCSGDNQQKPEYPDPVLSGWNTHGTCEDGIWFNDLLQSGEKQRVKRMYVYVIARVPLSAQEQQCAYPLFQWGRDIVGSQSSTSVGVGQAWSSCGKGWFLSRHVNNCSWKLEGELFPTQSYIDAQCDQ